MAKPQSHTYIFIPFYLKYTAHALKKLFVKERFYLILPLT
ncbi:Hypothetical protein BN2458_PEG1442 [Helicobacter typhlonius]|uniref:Uncharacterized protein n=1 Tax=Helicobacter typhlonius TaxID=76936 RepID=A0A0S4PVR2_9HELI|nr:Hypothetical protein BN2458_PEG1442 [Helicobacter typhlonius]